MNTPRSINPSNVKRLPRQQRTLAHGSLSWRGPLRQGDPLRRQQGDSSAAAAMRRDGKGGKTRCGSEEYSHGGSIVWRNVQKLQKMDEWRMKGKEGQENGRRRAVGVNGSADGNYTLFTNYGD